MLAITLIGILLFFGSMIYLTYHLARKIKHRNRTLPKGKFYTVLLSSILMFIIGGANIDDFDYSSMKELSETNTILLEENEEAQLTIKKLKTTITGLEEKNTTAHEKIEALTLQLTDAEQSEKAHIEKISAHEEKITNLEKKNVALAKNETSLNNKITELEEKNKVAATSKTETNASSSNNTVVNSSPAKAAVKSAPATQECNIKGSNSGIYHTPSSSYYDRTTNVAQWFCSEQEAINAGYRAPKR